MTDDQKQKLSLSIRDTIFKLAEEYSANRVEVLGILGGIYVQFAEAYDVSPQRAVMAIQGAFRAHGLSKPAAIKKSSDFCECHRIEISKCPARRAPIFKGDVN